MKLPALLAEIEQVVGRDVAIKFGAVCGGTRIYVPAKLNPRHWLVEAIGFDAAQALATHFSCDQRGLHLDVPMIPRAMQIKTLDDAGASAREIALTLKIHQRTVYSHRRQRRRDDEKPRQ